MVNVVSVMINVFIVIKIKYIISSNMSDICDKPNFIINYIHFSTTDTKLIKKYTLYKF